MEQEIYMRVADKTKCPCRKCVIGFLNGWDNWKCKAFLEGKPREILYENKPCPKFKPFLKKDVIAFVDKLNEKYGEDYSVCCIAKYNGKLYASLISKDHLTYGTLEQDAPAYVLENNDIKTVYGIEQSVTPFIKGEIVFKNHELYDEDDEDASTLVHDKVNKLLSSYANDENAINEFLKDIGF